MRDKWRTDEMRLDRYVNIMRNFYDYAELLHIAAKTGDSTAYNELNEHLEHIMKKYDIKNDLFELVDAIKSNDKTKCEELVIVIREKVMESMK